MITLYTFGPQWDIADPSPFCIKVESFLKLAKLDYKRPAFEMAFFKKSPKGKFPFIEDNGQLIGDSTLIIEYLTQKHAVNLDASLTSEQSATSHAFRRMLDEHLYWPLLRSRWIDDRGWNVIAPLFFGEIPFIMRGFIERKQRKYVARRIEMQGMGKHSQEEMYAMAKKDIAALATILGESTYFFGTEKPGLLDIWSHAYLINIIKAPIENEIKEATLAHEALCVHTCRIQELLYTSSSAEGAEHTVKVA